MGMCLLHIRTTRAERCLPETGTDREGRGAEPHALKPVTVGLFRNREYRQDFSQLSSHYISYSIGAYNTKQFSHREMNSELPYKSQSPLVNHTKSLWNILALQVPQQRQIQATTTILQCAVKRVAWEAGAFLLQIHCSGKNDVRRNRRPRVKANLTQDQILCILTSQ